MKQINQIFSYRELAKDHRKIKDQSNEKPRGYTRKEPYKPYSDIEKKVYNPTEYRFRLIIFFKDRLDDPSYRGTWIKSLDKYGSFIDEWTGLMKLERRIKHTYYNKYTRAIIYMNINNDFSFPVAHFYKDEELKSLSNKPLIKIPFRLEGKNHLVNLEDPKLLNDIIAWKK